MAQSLTLKMNYMMSWRNEICTRRLPKKCIVSPFFELNPVRAGMVKQARSYDRSSYRANALGAADSLLTPHPVYAALGNTAEGRQTAYRALFRHRQDEEELENIRNSTQGGWALGGEKFREEIAQNLKRRAAPLPRGGDRSNKQTDEIKQGRFALF